MSGHTNQENVDVNEVDPRRVQGGTERDVLFSRLPQNPGDLLTQSLFPEDAYSGETYWAGLPVGLRTKWVNRQQNEEIGREFAIVWRMFKHNPLSPVRANFCNYVVTGLGFFTEGYVLFSVGNILTLFEVVWKSCYKEYKVCNKVWIETINYLEIVGVIVGQIMIGILGDWIGRRWWIIQDATTMFLGTVLLTAMCGKTLNGWVIMYAVSLLISGTGVDGEYPMTSVTAMEASRNDKLHRGRSVLLAFLMQGWGQLINQAVLIILKLIFHSGASPPYSEISAQDTFRVSFAFISVFLLLLIYIRTFKLRNVDQHSRPNKQNAKVTGYDVQSLKLVTSHYWHRLLATSVRWFCNDFPFYGNQIFRNVFLKLVTSNSDQVVTFWLYNMINVGCELV